MTGLLTQPIGNEKFLKQSQKINEPPNELHQMSSTTA